MSASNFLACFNETESFEGGYVNNPHDPGGATLKGVTQATYSGWLRANGRLDAPVRGASDADIQAIYREYYWNPMHGDDLFNGLDLVMVDTAWGSGPAEAIKFLQRALGVAADGKFGSLTLGALMACKDHTQLLETICAEREAFFRSLPTWQYFGKGWQHRLDGIHAAALKMNAATPIAGNAPSASKPSGAPKDTPPMANTTASPGPAAGQPAWLQDVEIGFDMLQNFNFSQMGDAIKTGIQTAATDPLKAVEDIANKAVQVAAVAGVPYAGTIEAFLPMAENMLNFALSIKNMFPAHAASQATAISSPPTMAPQSVAAGS